MPFYLGTLKFEYIQGTYKKIDTHNTKLPREHPVACKNIIEKYMKAIYHPKVEQFQEFYYFVVPIFCFTELGFMHNDYQHT